MYVSFIILTFFFIDAVRANEGTNCANAGDIRLYNGTIATEGGVQICTDDNEWSAMCDYSWDCIDGAVACNQLGYIGSDPLLFSDAHFGTWNVWNFGYFQCSGTENRLLDCATNTHSSYCTQKDQAGLRCVTYTSMCTHGDLQLTGGDESLTEGKLELCYNGIWTPVCHNNIDGADTIVICKELGHTQYSWASLFTEGYGATPLVKQYLQPDCSNSATKTKLIDCTTNSSLVEGCTMHCNIARIKCFDPGECEEGSIRIVGGDIEQEGRIEVCMNGVWGTICNSHFSVTDGYVACKQLGKGTANEGPIVYSHSEYGDGEYPIVMSNVGCEGWEKSITDCSHTSYESTSCSRANLAGVLCHDDCEEGDVRLTEGHKGTVEICLNSLWGMIAQSGWSSIDGEVVCQQLGYTSEGTKAFNGSYYGKPNRPVNINNVACTGTENTLMDCKYSEFAFSDKKSLRSLIEVAGVKCNTNGVNDGVNSDTPTCTPPYPALMGGVFVTLASIVTVVIILVVLVIIQVLIYTRFKKRKPNHTNAMPLKTNGAYAAPQTRKRPILPSNA